MSKRPLFVLQKEGGRIPERARPPLRRRLPIPWPQRTTRRFPEYHAKEV